jgi:hypothetical protein
MMRSSCNCTWYPLGKNSSVQTSGDESDIPPEEKAIMGRSKAQSQQPGARPESSSEDQRLLDAMQAKGLLSNDDIDETALEASLPPYGSEEEAALFEELANEFGKAFQAAGTTITDEVRAERDE